MFAIKFLRVSSIKIIQKRPFDHWVILLRCLGTTAFTGVLFFDKMGIAFFLRNEPSLCVVLWAGCESTKFNFPISLLLSQCLEHIWGPMLERYSLLACAEDF